MVSDVVVSLVLYKYIPYGIGLLVLYAVVSWANIKRLERKFGAKPARFQIRDGCFGFQIWYPLLKHKMNGTLIDYWHENFEAYDAQTGSSRIMGKRAIATRDPENIKAILGTQFNDFALGDRHHQFFPLLGDGIFTLDGAGWKHSRTMLRPQFAREQIAHVHSLESHLQTLAKHIRKADGKKFDLQDLFFSFTVDTATEFLFGESVKCLEDESIGFPKDQSDIPGRPEFADAFNRAQIHMSNRVIFQEFYWLYNPRDFKQSNRIVHSWAEYYVKRALSFSEEELEKVSKDGYIFLYELAKQTRDPQVLKDQLLNIMVAGRDTTAGLLSFAFFELARNPQVLKKLQQEIWETFGKGEDARVSEITFESLKKCEYLKAVINETLRMYPSVPQNFRCATKNTTLPRGGGPKGMDPILVTKGELVMYMISSTHRNKEYYGKDVDVFRPERWFEPETRKLGWAFLPFNGGPRICLGQQFALTEASYVITRLLQMFESLESFDDKYPPKKASHLTMNLQDGCIVSLK
jgi:cytochrome P450